MPNPNADPVVARPPWRRSYGQWQISRMRDVRAVLGDAGTRPDNLSIKALSRFCESRGIEVPMMTAFLTLLARSLRRPNDEERHDAIAVTRRLTETLPMLDMRTRLATLAGAGGMTADATTAVLGSCILPWRSAALSVNADLCQKIEDGLLHLLVTIERSDVSELAALEPQAAAIFDDLSRLTPEQGRGLEIPVRNLVSPAFLAIQPLSRMGVSMLAHLADHPDLQETLRDRPALRQGYLREVERFLASIRYVTRQIGPGGLDLGDVQLPPRCLVILDLVAANRDPDLWDEPQMFCLDRARQQTATFSFGSLACTGGQLSRQFLGRLLDTVLETTRLSLPQASDGPDRIPSRWSLIRGYDMCRLRFSAL